MDRAKLGDAYATLKQGTLWRANGRCKGYATSNPGEAAMLDAYVAAIVGGGNPTAPLLVTATGQGIVGMIAAGMVADPAPNPDPGPTPPPPTGTRPFSDASAFNKAIPANPPIHPDSAAMISTATTWLFPGPYQEWLGPRDRVYYMRAAFSDLPKTTLWVNFLDQVGYQCSAHNWTGPMPSGWDRLLGPNPASYDRSTWIADPVTGDVWEGYRVTPPGTASMDISCDSSRWNCVRMDFLAACEKGLGYGTGFSSSGSGILMGVGMLVPADFADMAGVIPHALRGNWNCGSDGSGGHPINVPPASSGDGLRPGGIPMGARVQLDPALDVDNDPIVNAKPEPWRSGLKKLGRTLQQYGIVGVDSSGGPGGGGIEAAVEGSVAPYTFPWHGIGDYQRGIPYSWMSRFRVIDWRQWTGA